MPARCKGTGLMKKSNPHAVTIAVVSLLLLSAGVSGPFMTVTKLNIQTQYSILQTVEHLFKDQHIALALVVVLFSIVFPLSKLIFITVVATRVIPISARSRGRMLAIAEKTALFSMVDVMVVALLIVVLKVEGVAKVEAAWGTGCFFASVLLSIISGFMVDTSKFAANGRIADCDASGDGEVDSPRAEDANRSPKANRLIGLCVLAVGMLAIVGSLALQQIAPASEITAILVTYKPSVLGNLEIGEDDLYLRLLYEQDGATMTHDTEMIPVRRLGNGITWDVSAEKIPLTSLRKITIFDEDLIYDDEYDAVDVTLGEPLIGTTYEFVIHSSSPWFAAINPLLYSGIALLVIGGIMLLRHSASDESP